MGPTTETRVQETWLAVLTGITRFEGRSSVKTWIFKILTNRAKTRAIRERRTINFSELEDPKEPDQPAVDPSRFLPVAHPTHPGHWASPPEAWSASAEDAVVGREMMRVLQRELERLPPGQRIVVALRDVHGWPAVEVMRVLQRELERLPPGQRIVVALRDVHGWPAVEVCDVLGLSEANQRVLLHRGRSRLRGVLEAYFAENA